MSYNRYFATEEDTMKTLETLHQHMEEGFRKYPGRANERMIRFFQVLEYYCIDHCEPIPGDDAGDVWDNRRMPPQCSK